MLLLLLIFIEYNFEILSGNYPTMMSINLRVTLRTQVTGLESFFYGDNANESQFIATVLSQFNISKKHDFQVSYLRTKRYKFSI